ncbi:MAG TPA: hypothetical protein PK251_14895 [Candidatus Latescibacteria bacterium]|nr:hypothetical protein [Candidatus Latescibacterota bacterium]HOS66025.1 hypothetical protein [Candidatus Latescibacterota bacterium]HRT28347.1 hypothetical protein [Kiritimatiellia bacterium]
MCERIWTAALILTALTTAFAAHTTEPKNALANPGFENANAKEGWDLPSIGWKILPGEGRGGSNGLVWECADPKQYTFPRVKFRAEPGGVYRFGAYVKVDRLPEEKNRPEVSLDWSDANGKWLSAAGAQPVADNDPKADGWVRYEGQTPPLPAKAASANVLCYLPRGLVGRVRFDDFWLHPLPERPVDYLQCSAYKNEFARNDGPIRFITLLHVNPLKNPVEELRGELVFQGRDGARQIVEANVLDIEHAETTVDAERFTEGAQSVVFRLVRRADGDVLGSTDLKVRCTETPRKRRVAIDAKGRTLLDGKPFFPIGLYTGRMSDEDLVVWKKGPFNFAMQYGEVSAQDLDRWQSIGVYAAADVRKLIYGYDYSAKSPYKTFAESQAAFRKKFEEIGRHPAFFAWYLVDEVPVRFVPNIRAVNEFLHELDPDHPTYTVTDKPKDVQALLPCFDVLGIDPYPIGNRGARADISICSGWANEARGYTFGMRGMWHVAQTFNWGWYRPQEAADTRMPSRAEIANMTWQLVAAGANGLCSYAFHAMRKNLKGEAFDKAWADVCAVALDVKSVEAVLLSDEVPPAFGGIPEKALVVRTCRQGGKDWVLVANRTMAPVKATLESPRRYASLRTALGGGVALSAVGDLTVDFQPLGYAFVELGM